MTAVTTRQSELIATSDWQGLRGLSKIKRMPATVRQHFTQVGFRTRDKSCVNRGGFVRGGFGCHFRLAARELYRDSDACTGYSKMTRGSLGTLMRLSPEFGLLVQVNSTLHR